MDLVRISVGGMGHSEKIYLTMTFSKKKKKL